MDHLLDYNCFLVEYPIEMLKFLVCVKGGMQPLPGHFYGLATAFQVLKQKAPTITNTPLTDTSTIQSTLHVHLQSPFPSGPPFLSLVFGLKSWNQWTSVTTKSLK